MRRSGYERNKLLIFMGFYKKHWKLFALDMSCAFLMAGIDLVFPLASRYALKELLPNNAYSFFFAMIGSLVLMYAVRSILAGIVTYFGHGLGVLIEADVRQSLFNHMQKLSFTFYDKNRTGQMISRVTNDLFEITELSHHGPEDLFISLITIIGALIILFRINWKLALFLLILVPLALLFTISQRRRMMQTSKRVKERVAGINTEIESSISGIRVSKAFTNEDYEIEKFASGNERFKISKREFYGSMAIFHGGMEFFINLFSVAVIGLGGYFIMQGEMETIDVLTFSMYVSNFLSPVKKLTNFVEQFTTGMAGFSRYVEVMRLEPEIQDKPKAKDIGKVRGSIDIHDLSFSYSGKENVFSHLNLSIEAGKTLAIVGPSGGGKTTLCHLIPRFYEAKEGSISIDGKDIRDITLESLRKNIGIVSQDVFLFSGSVRENIRYGKVDATDEEIYAAARSSEIYDTVMAMPDGFDTQVGERGIMLSGGQKQRISIARIFLKNPPILILDEATSSLDTVTEHRIQESFDELSKGRTTLVIAHRLSTIHNADEIIYIDERGIKERGNHQKLMEKGGAYASLYKAQFGASHQEAHQ